MRGRPRRLTPEQAAELRRRYQLWRDGLRHSPYLLAQDFGINVRSAICYGQRRHKEPA